MLRAEALATQIAANAPLAVRRTLEIVDAGLDKTLEQGLQEEAARFG